MRACVHAQVVAACRAAIKAENMGALHKVIRDGQGPVSQQQKGAAERAVAERGGAVPVH